MSLDEIEAFSKDNLTRAGVSPLAASSVARATRMAERNGTRIGGLERLARILEGLLMGGIDLHAAPVLRDGPSGRILVEARSGLSDHALGLGLRDLMQQATEAGVAVLSVAGAGDAPHLPVWVERLTDEGFVAMAVSADGGGLVSEPQAGPAPGPLLPVSRGRSDHGWAAVLVGALTADRAGTPPADDMPYDQSHHACFSLLALRPVGSRSGQRHTLDTLGLSPDAADRAARRHQADTEGVAVPSDLIARIVNM